jgi:hypothetical protein
VKSISVPYKSGWFTVGIPALTFLMVWWGSSLLVLAALDWGVSDWMGMLICAGGILPGLIASVAIYPLLLRFAARGRGELRLERAVLDARIGFRRQLIDLGKTHEAKIAADAGCTSLTLQNDHTYLNLFFRGLPREKVLDVFQAPYFIDELVVTPEMGSWGFDVEAGASDIEDFATLLLQTMWRQRRQNRSFLVYERYPWDLHPQPEFHYIRLIEWGKCSAEAIALIEQLEQQFVDGLTDSYVRVTPDYLVGWVYHSLRSTLTGHPDYYCVMPLGHIRAEVSLPRPDWEPFIIGHVLKEALASALSAATPAGGPYLEDRQYLYVRGRDENGDPLELAFDWYRPGDANYDEANLIVRFVNRIGNKSVRQSMRELR